MNKKEMIYELESIICLWEKDYKLAGTNNRITAVKEAIKIIQQQNTEEKLNQIAKQTFKEIAKAHEEEKIWNTKQCLKNTKYKK